MVHRPLPRRLRPRRLRDPPGFSDFGRLAPSPGAMSNTGSRRSAGLFLDFGAPISRPGDLLRRHGAPDCGEAYGGGFKGQLSRKNRGPLRFRGVPSHGPDGPGSNCPALSNRQPLCINCRIPGQSGGLGLGINMRKVALLAAIALPFTFVSVAPTVAQDFYELNKNTFLFLQGPGGPGAPAATAPAPGMKVAKVSKKKKGKK